MPAVSVCAHCGVEFEHNKAKDRKYCSRECWDEARSVNVEKVCKYCGKTYVVHTTSKAKQQQFCSPECGNLFEGEKRKAFEVRTCPNCEGTFEVSPPSRPKKYCSTECYREFAYKRSMIEYVCEQCGETFSAPRREKRRFCSRECNGKFLSEEGTETCECARCGEEFARVKSSKQVFCSRKCSNLFDAGYEDPQDVPDRAPKRYRKVAEAKLDRDLEPWEVVHHINMDSSDNSEENIHVFSNNQKHQWSHGSLNKCVKTLMELDFLRFENGEYTVPV